MRNHLFLLVFASFFLGSCAAYHDTTSRFNAYFLAKEKMKEVETALFSEQKDDFNNVLGVLPLMDSSSTGSQKANLEYCISKASIPIRFHEESKWIDDCYLLIAKSRMYLGDNVNAVNTYKYLNGSSDDPNIRHQALIGLMRAFSATEQYAGVEQVMKEIANDPEPFSLENIPDFYLVAADYYRNTGNLPRAAQYLEKAVPLVKPKFKQARYYFMLGQIYQEAEDTGKAFENYQKVLASRPSYDLEFNTLLNSAQVFDPTNSTEVKNTEKFFKKLLVDEKNTEFKDRIYYEMGNFEVRRGALKKAMDNFNQSLEFAQVANHADQKAYTYVRMGEVYFEQKDFENAANYYDSASFVITPQMKNHKQVQGRVGVLKDFVKEYKNIEKQKRLLNLAKMSVDEQKDFFKQEIAKERLAIDENLKKQAEKTQQKKDNNQKTNTKSKGASNWYFYNETAISAGRLEFAKDWAGRPLEDNWRRSNKGFSNVTDLLGADNTDENEEYEGKAADNVKNMLYASLKSLGDRMKEVPKDELQVKETKENLANSLFALAKIYYQKLDDKQTAVYKLQDFTKNYVGNENIPEALFFLKAICEDLSTCQSGDYEKELRENHPNSKYTRLLDNTNYQEESVVNNSEVVQKYEEAYQLYQTKKYTDSKQIVDATIQKYPVNVHSDKLELLRTMLVGKTASNVQIYINELDNFMQNYKDSPLIPFAKDLLKAAEQ